MAIDKNAVIKEAQKFAAKGQFNKAIAEWKKLIKDTPHDANLYNTIGDLCLKKKDGKPEAVDAYKKAADILAQDGFTSKAIALYKKVINIDPKKIEVHLALGDLNAEKGLVGNALESYKVAADHYTQQNEKAKALGIYQKMADLNPANITFRLKLADMYAKEGMKREAIKAYLEAADVHVSKNAFPEARHIFEKVLTLDPNNKAVYHKAGVVYFKEGKFVEACKAFKPAFENDPKNEELADLYVEALSKSGRDAEAEDVFMKLLAQDAGRIDLREKLFRLYLARKEHGKALNEAATIAEARLKMKDTTTEKGLKLLPGQAPLDEDTSAALEMLKSLVAESPSYVDARRKLSDFYVKIGRVNDAAQELLHAADILVPMGDKDGAKDALALAIQLAPDMEEAKQRLEALVSPEATAPPVEAQPIEEKAPGPPPVEEAPAISEAMTEIDVLVKYGLAAKAVEQLEGLAGKFPESLRVRTRLRDIYRDQGNAEKAVEHALLAADLCIQRGQQEQGETMLREALEIDPGNSDILSRLGMAPVPAAQLVFEEALPAFEEPAAPVGPAEAAPAPEAPVAPPAFEEALTFEEPALPEAGPALAPEETPGEAPQSISEGVSEQVPEDAVPAAEIPEAPLPEAGEESVAAPPEEEAPIQEPVAAEVDLSEVWAEAEFYYQQGLFDEAQKHYEKMLEHRPGDRRTLERISEISRQKEEVQEFSKLAEAVEGLEGMVPSEAAGGEMAQSASDEEAVRSLMQEIQMLKREAKSEPPPPVEEISVPPPKETAPRMPQPVIETGPAGGREGPSERAGGEEFFDLGEELRGEGKAVFPREKKEASEDFFDLAAELRDELSGIAVPERSAVSAEEQSLDDIFEEFKKGVEEQSGREDVNTHYNLGIAYKEMGLLDDAISEFLLTPEGEPRFVDSKYMLGLCLMEKGEYHKAAAEIQNALSFSDSLGADNRERIGMHYDLGLAHQGSGNIADALNEFQKAYNGDPGYRDVAAKLEELREGEFISLEQLKEDIEKEISAKFFEEGERIEREEKNKKNEKVRN